MRERNDPFEQMDRMLEQMRRSLWTGYGGPESRRFGAWNATALPEGESELGHQEYGTSEHTLSVDRTDEGFVVLADLPGFEKEEIELTFEDGVLSIAGTHEVTDGHSARSRTVRESVTIPGDVVVDEISATYQNGVLEVTLPAHVEESPDRHIDIE